jgi:hypothetical protein
MQLGLVVGFGRADILFSTMEDKVGKHGVMGPYIHCGR